ncbi:MAG TPA: metalloregulator ArsR/SmtB family transcription factor [Amycolatopsis sp.]|nr:metalloregulator ArsR/SmtB family transcription factor [Amycolatopsis sp.]
MGEEPERRVIDAEAVNAALAGLGDRAVVHQWAERFSVLADPSRLTLLVCIHYARQISVSDLAAVAGMTDTAVSQALRLLRAHGLVTGHRTGRVVRYSLADATIHDLIHQVRPHPASPGV